MEGGNAGSESSSQSWNPCEGAAIGTAIAKAAPTYPDEPVSYDPRSPGATLLGGTFQDLGAPRMGSSPTNPCIGWRWKPPTMTTGVGP
jgi:hypothetical protein